MLPVEREPLTREVPRLPVLSRGCPSVRNGANEVFGPSTPGSRAAAASPLGGPPDRRGQHLGDRPGRNRFRVKEALAPPPSVHGVTTSRARPTTCHWRLRVARYGRSRWFAFRSGRAESTTRSWRQGTVASRWIAHPWI